MLSRLLSLCPGLQPVVCRSTATRHSISLFAASGDVADKGSLRAHANRWGRVLVVLADVRVMGEEHSLKLNLIGWCELTLCSRVFFRHGFLLLFRGFVGLGSKVLGL